MAAITSWSTTAASNNSPSPNGFPENMAPSGLNDSMREVMAQVRTWYEDPQFIDYGDTPTQTSATTFTVTGDQTARYPVGTRLRLTDSSTARGVVSAVAYTSVTTITIRSGFSLTASLSAFEVLKTSRSFYTPQDFNAVADGDGAGGGTDDSTAIQAAFDWLEDNGGQLVADGAKIYRCNTAVACLMDQAATKRRYVLNFNGAMLDFSGSGLTSGDLVSIGADAEANFQGADSWVINNLTIKGPETLTPTGNTATTTTIGLHLEYAQNVVMNNVRAPNCHVAIKSTFSFPLLANSCDGSLSYIPLYLLGASNNQLWNNFQAADVQFGPVISDDASYKISGVTFIQPRVEGADSGFIVTSNGSTNDRVRDITVIDPYFADITYDFFRAGLVFDSSAPATRGANASGQVVNLNLLYGHYGNGGSWTATHAFLVASTAAGVRALNAVVPVVDDANAIVGLIKGGSIDFQGSGIAGNPTEYKKVIFDDDGNRVFVVDKYGVQFEEVSFSDADATPDVSRGNYFKTANTGATTITNFDGLGSLPKNFKVLINDANTTVDFSSATLFGGNGISTKLSANDLLDVTYDGSSVFYIDILESHSADDELTIATGAIAVNSRSHSVDTESDAATDDLDTINGALYRGQRVTLRAEDSARTVVIKNGTGNINCGADFSLDHVNDRAELEYNGSSWVAISLQSNS